MKKLNKVIAAMMMMAITTAMPAMAGNKNHNDKKGNVVVVNNRITANTSRQSSSHFDKVEKALSHSDAHKGHAYRPNVKTYTFKVSRHGSYKKIVAKAEHINGVMDAKWNPRTREVTIRYDANKTSVKHIKRSVA